MSDTPRATTEDPVPTGNGPARPPRRRTGPLTAMAVVLGLVALLSIIALTGLNNSRSADDRFVNVIRNVHPELSADDVSDAELLALAKRSCGPDGLTGSDRVRLEHLGITETSFRDEAVSFCPTR